MQIKTNTVLSNISHNSMSIKIYTDWLNEAKTEKNLQGFILNYGVILIGAYPTFVEFASSVMDSLGASEEEYGFIPDAENLVYKIEEWIRDEDDIDIRENWVFWHGLTPRSDKPFLERASEGRNAFLVVEDYQEAFTNAKVVLTKNKTGNSNDISYLSKSIDINPDLLELYVDTTDLQKWEKDAILSGVKKIDPKVLKYYTSVRKTM